LNTQRALTDMLLGGGDGNGPLHRVCSYPQILIVLNVPDLIEDHFLCPVCNL